MNSLAEMMTLVIGESLDDAYSRRNCLLQRENLQEDIKNMSCPIEWVGKYR